MRILKSFWKPITWAIVVLFLSTLSGRKVEELPLANIPHMDKVIHFGMYFIFTFLLLLDLSRYLRKIVSWKQIILFSTIAAIAYGGLMEILQEIPSIHRDTDIKDFLANSAGVGCAVLFYKYLSAAYNKLTSIFIKRENNWSL